MDQIVWNFTYTEELYDSIKDVSSRFEPALFELNNACITLNGMVGQRQQCPLLDVITEVKKACRRIEAIREDIDMCHKAVERSDAIFRTTEKRIMRYIAGASDGTPSAREESSGSLFYTSRAASLDDRLFGMISPAWLARAADEEFNRPVM